MYHYEFCPKCQAICKTSLSVSMIKAVNACGEKSDLLVFNLHCEACLTFIRRMEEKASQLLEPSMFPAYLP